MRASAFSAVSVLIVAISGGSLVRAETGRNVFWYALTDTVIVCPAGDSVTVDASHPRPSRIRGVLIYLNSSYTPRVGVPPESIWVVANSVGTDNVTVNDQPKIFADDSTDASGHARITLPSVSGCGRLRLVPYVSGYEYSADTVVVRSLDGNADGRVTVDDTNGAHLCDLDLDGDVDEDDLDLSTAAVGVHDSHWHRHALFGTLVRRTSLCRTCTGHDPPYTLGDSQSSWSPNGRYVTYTEFIPESSHVVCRTFRTHSNPREGNDSLAIAYPPAGKHDYDPNWSPLGTEIAFDRGDNTVIRKGIRGIVADTTEHVVVSGHVGPNDSGANMPVFSPDGQWIAYTLKDQRGDPYFYQDVWRVSVADTTNKVRITSERYAFYPQWSTDGRWITYSDNSEGRYYVAKVRGDLATVQTPTLLVSPPSAGGTLGLTLQPAFAPDSLAGVVGYGVNYLVPGVFEPTADTTKIPVRNYIAYALYDPLPPDTLFATAANSPRWSPDGTRLVLRSPPPGVSSEQPQIWATRRNMSLPPTVTSVGGRAIIDSLPYIDTTVVGGDAISLTVVASDPEGDPLTYGAFFLRPDLGMTFSSHTFSWTTTDDEGGQTFTIKFIVTTPSGGTAYALARIHVVGSDGGCPFVDTRVGPDWVAENTILGRSPYGTAIGDTYHLKTIPTAAGGRYSLRIREHEHEVTTLDQAAMLAVDHTPGVQAYWVGDGFVLGESRVVAHVSRALGAGESKETRKVPNSASTPGDITTLLDGTHPRGFLGAKGDTLLVERSSVGPPHSPDWDPVINGPVTADSTVLVINGLIKGERADSSIVPDALVGTRQDRDIIEHTGILVQAEDGRGAWKIVKHLYPRERSTETAIRVPATGRLRLVFLDRHEIRYIGELDVAGIAYPDTLALLAAHHSEHGEVLSKLANADGVTDAITPGDTVSLEFAAPPVSQGMTRDLFLYSNGSYTSVPHVPSTSRTWRYELTSVHPSPAIGLVQLAFTAARQGPVSIRIYDVSGRLVRTLLDADVGAGQHTLAWDGRNTAGRIVSRGVYFCRMTAGEAAWQRRVVMVAR